MSLQELLQKQRKNLKLSTTTVTTATGEKFIESKIDPSQNIKLCQNQYGFIVDMKPDKVPACILDNFLYLGSQDAVNLENIIEFKLTHILSIGIPMPFVEEIVPKNKFIPCLDLPETNLFDGILQEAIKFIESSRSSMGRVLVHCNAGVSRSVSVVIGYLMLHQGMSFSSSYALVKSKRECIQPNVGFIKQLTSQIDTNLVYTSKSN